MKERERGEFARQVLENPIWVEAWDKYESGLISAWRKATDTETRERAHLELKTIEKVKRAIETVMKTGEMAQMQLDDEAKRDVNAR